MILYPISSTEQTTELVLSCRLRYIAYTSQYLMRLSYLVFQCESLLRICSVLLVIESMLLLQQNGSVLLVLVWFKLDIPLQRPTFHAYIKM